MRERRRAEFSTTGALLMTPSTDPASEQPIRHELGIILRTSRTFGAKAHLSLVRQAGGVNE